MEKSTERAREEKAREKDEHSRGGHSIQPAPETFSFATEMNVREGEKEREEDKEQEHGNKEEQEERSGQQREREEQKERATEEVEEEEDRGNNRVAEGKTAMSPWSQNAPCAFEERLEAPRRDAILLSSDSSLSSPSVSVSLCVVSPSSRLPPSSSCSVKTGESNSSSEAAGALSLPNSDQNAPRNFDSDKSSSLLNERREAHLGETETEKRDRTAREMSAPSTLGAREQSAETETDKNEAETEERRDAPGDRCEGEEERRGSDKRAKGEERKAREGSGEEKDERQKKKQRSIRNERENVADREATEKGTGDGEEARKPRTGGQRDKDESEVTQKIEATSKTQKTTERANEEERDAERNQGAKADTAEDEEGNVSSSPVVSNPLPPDLASSRLGSSALSSPSLPSASSSSPSSSASLSSSASSASSASSVSSSCFPLSSSCSQSKTPKRGEVEAAQAGEPQLPAPARRQGVDMEIQTETACASSPGLENPFSSVSAKRDVSDEDLLNLCTKFIHLRSELVRLFSQASTPDLALSMPPSVPATGTGSLVSGAQEDRERGAAFEGLGQGASGCEETVPKRSASQGERKRQREEAEEDSRNLDGEGERTASASFARVSEERSVLSSFLSPEKGDTGREGPCVSPLRPRAEKQLELDDATEATCGRKGRRRSRRAGSLQRDSAGRFEKACSRVAACEVKKLKSQTASWEEARCLVSSRIENPAFLAAELAGSWADPLTPEKKKFSDVHRLKKIQPLFTDCEAEKSATDGEKERRPLNGGHGERRHSERREGRAEREEKQEKRLSSSLPRMHFAGEKNTFSRRMSCDSTLPSQVGVCLRREDSLRRSLSEKKQSDTADVHPTRRASVSSPHPSALEALAPCLASSPRSLRRRASLSRLQQTPVFSASEKKSHRPAITSGASSLSSSSGGREENPRDRKSRQRFPSPFLSSPFLPPLLSPDVFSPSAVFPVHSALGHARESPEETTLSSSSSASSSSSVSSLASSLSLFSHGLAPQPPGRELRSPQSACLSSFEEAFEDGDLFLCSSTPCEAFPSPSSTSLEREDLTRRLLSGSVEGKRTSASPAASETPHTPDSGPAAGLRGRSFANKPPTEELRGDQEGRRRRKRDTVTAVADEGDRLCGRTDESRPQTQGEGPERSTEKKDAGEEREYIDEKDERGKTEDRGKQEDREGRLGLRVSSSSRKRTAAILENLLSDSCPSFFSERKRKILDPWSLSPEKKKAPEEKRRGARARDSEADPGSVALFSSSKKRRNLSVAAEGDRDGEAGGEGETELCIFSTSQESSQAPEEGRKRDLEREERSENSSEGSERDGFPTSCLHFARAFPESGPASLSPFDRNANESNRTSPHPSCLLSPFLATRAAISPPPASPQGLRPDLSADLLRGHLRGEGPPGEWPSFPTNTSGKKQSLFSPVPPSPSSSSSASLLPPFFETVYAVSSSRPQNGQRPLADESSAGVSPVSPVSETAGAPKRAQEDLRSSGEAVAVRSGRRKKQEAVVGALNSRGEKSDRSVSLSGLQNPTQSSASLGKAQRYVHSASQREALTRFSPDVASEASRDSSHAFSLSWGSSEASVTFPAVDRGPQDASVSALPAAARFCPPSALREGEGKMELQKSLSLTEGARALKKGAKGCMDSLHGSFASSSCVGTKTLASPFSKRGPFASENRFAPHLSPGACLRENNGDENSLRGPSSGSLFGLEEDFMSPFLCVGNPPNSAVGPETDRREKRGEKSEDASQQGEREVAAFAAEPCFKGTRGKSRGEAFPGAMRTRRGTALHATRSESRRKVQETGDWTLFPGTPSPAEASLSGRQAKGREAERSSFFFQNPAGEQALPGDACMHSENSNSVAARGVEVEERALSAASAAASLGSSSERPAAHGTRRDARRTKTGGTQRGGGRGREGANSCRLCKARHTPQWRYLDGLPVCNACYMRARKRQQIATGQRKPVSLLLSGFTAAETSSSAALSSLSATLPSVREAHSPHPAGPPSASGNSFPEAA
ncbi:GATA zinc finger domain-containing protein [Toxoplasma gondii RUB]|uniref:GATA zinc finger domain-containing protein n=1 Tax=Toxoplasma gondii RUB TaxID=935652 RepID=A0A086M3F5_TOXGO|nr:GATA zinc finger domain-containing protein [Toxoplasma gondii RUB]